MTVAPPIQWSIFTIDLDSRPKKGGRIKRPVLVVSRESANQALPVVTVLPLTDFKSGRRIYPNEVVLPSGTAGLKKDVIAMAHQTRTVAKVRLAAPVGTVEDDELRSEIRRAMCVQLHLEPG